MAPNRALMSDRRDRVGEKSHEYTLLSLTLGGVIPRDMDNPKGKFPAQFNTYKVVRPNDFVFCLFDIDETPRGVGLSNHAGMITGAYDVFSPTHRVNPRFLYYYYLFVDQGKLMKPFYVGLRKTIQRGTFAGIKAPLPPTAEQAAIVRFLDHWNGRLEKAIRAKRRVIALLQEQKQAIIHRAVTRGLDPNVKLKDSGIPWLGEIPEYWEVQRLKRVCRVQGGYAFPASSFGETGTPVVRMNNLRRGVLDFESVARIPATECVQAFALKNGDILYGLSGSIGATGSLGNYAVVAEHDLPAMLNQRIARFVPKLDKIHPNFLIQIIQSSIFYEQVLADTTGTAQFNVSTNDIENVAVALPPISEQASLVLRVNERVAPITTAIARYEREITLLREYRTRLTADVVTGKLDACAAAAQLPDPEEALAEAENFEEEPELEEVEG